MLGLVLLASSCFPVSFWKLQSTPGPLLDHVTLKKTCSTTTWSASVVRQRRDETRSPGHAGVSIRLKSGHHAATVAVFWLVCVLQMLLQWVVKWSRLLSLCPQELALHLRNTGSSFVSGFRLDYGEFEKHARIWNRRKGGFITMLWQKLHSDTKSGSPLETEVDFFPTAKPDNPLKWSGLWPVSVVNFMRLRETICGFFISTEFVRKIKLQATYAGSKNFPSDPSLLVCLCMIPS